MAVKNFVFRGNWVDSKVAGMKTTFFAIFNPTWTHILDPKGPKFNSFRSILVKKERNYIIILVKKERNYIIIPFVTLELTK